MAFRYLLALTAVLLAVFGGVGIGWYIEQKLGSGRTAVTSDVAPDPVVTSDVAPDAGAGTPAPAPAAPARAPEPRPDVATVERSEPSATADAEQELLATAAGRLNPPPALSRRAEDDVEPAVRTRPATASPGASATAERMAGGGTEDEQALAPPAPAAESETTGGEPSAVATVPADRTVVTEPSPGEGTATRSGEEPSEPPATPPGTERPASPVAAATTGDDRRSPSEPPPDPEASSVEPEPERATAPDEPPEPPIVAEGEAEVADEPAGEDARSVFSLDMGALRERIARLFGRGGEPAQPVDDTPPADAKSAALEPQTDEEDRTRPPARSLSEESIRQAVRAAVAHDPLADPSAKVGPTPQMKRTVPSFDIVRLERDGAAVIAGRAEPGAKVEIRADDMVIDRVTADRRGNWVSIPPERLASGEHTLSLAASLDREADPEIVLESPGVVVARVPGPPRQPPDVRPAKGPPSRPAATAGDELLQDDPAALLPAIHPAEPVAVLLPRDGDGGGRILQAPGRIDGDGELALLILDYDQEGRVQLTGEGPAGAVIRIYVDNEPATTAVVGADGTWTARLDRRLPAGTYALRLDQLGPGGKPVARLETPFSRVDRPPRAGDVDVDYVVVQPGNSLWRIARRLGGKGIRYVHIYEANRGQIRDPDLIYPGQVFEVPASFRSSG